MAQVAIKAFCMHAEKTTEIDRDRDCYFFIKGNEQMLNEIKMHFKSPNSTDPVKQFIHMLYLTQVSKSGFHHGSGLVAFIVNCFYRLHKLFVLKRNPNTTDDFEVS